MNLHRRVLDWAAFVPLFLAFAVFLGIVVTTSAATAPNQSYIRCDNRERAPVVAELDLPNGAALFAHFPALGENPEISDPRGPLHGGPLHVIALQGPVCSIPAYGPLPDPDASSLPTKGGNVIRVIKPDGDEWDFGYGDFKTFVP